MRILEGPELSPPELAHGQGWSNAARSSQDVTGDAFSRAVQEATSVAVLAETDEAQRAVSGRLEELGARVADWAAVRARILASATAAGSAPSRPAGSSRSWWSCERSEPASAWLFEAGLALGALGGRAIVAQLGDEPPPAALEGPRRRPRRPGGSGFPRGPRRATATRDRGLRTS